MKQINPFIESNRIEYHVSTESNRISNRVSNIESMKEETE